MDRTLTATTTVSAVNKPALAFLVTATLGVNGCDHGSAYAYEEEDTEAAYETASDDLSDQTFEDVGDTGLCTEDCGGHDAGFEWAKENDVTDASECGGNSLSFEEGCEAYAEALEEQASEYEGEDEF
jgi:hypothetical protein